MFIVIASDEDDCSSPRPDFDSPIEGGDNDCAGELYPIERYSTLFRSLPLDDDDRNRSAVFLQLVAGVPLSVPADELSGEGCVGWLRDTVAQATVAGVSCRGPDGDPAYAPQRFIDVWDAIQAPFGCTFQASFASICADPWPELQRPTQTLVGIHWGYCLDRVPAGASDGTHGCAMWVEPPEGFGCEPLRGWDGTVREDGFCGTVELPFDWVERGFDEDWSWHLGVDDRAEPDPTCPAAVTIQPLGGARYRLECPPPG